MKNIFLLLLSILLFTVHLQAQKKPVATHLSVPENVTTSFKSQFAVSEQNQWSKNYSGNYVVNFTNADKLFQMAEYNPSGALVKSRVNYLPGALPQNVTDALAIQYPNVKLSECAKMQLPGVAPYYKVKILNNDNTSKELLISEEGTITE